MLRNMAWHSIPPVIVASFIALQSKVNGKSFNPGQDLGGRGMSRKASALEDNDISYSTSEFCDLPFESDRKEKFKMVIGKSKKEAQETEKESQDCGFTVDAAAAAAILQAATKGIKSSGLRYITNAVSNEDGQLANSGKKSDRSGSCDHSVMLPKTTAGTTSHEAAGGDDSSNANPTEEQKLKAERLKRAKMFVAMLKSGALPSRTGTSRGSSAEPVVLNSATSRASQEREGSFGPADNKSAVEGNFGERQSERQSKRKYRSKSVGSEDDQEDSGREGQLIRKRRSRSWKPEDDENENAVKKEHSYDREKGRHVSHSTEKSKNEGESSEDNKDHKHTKPPRSSHRSQGDEDESEGISKEEREAKDNDHHSERKYRSRSRSHRKGDEEVGDAVGKDQKHRRRKRRSHSSSEESENGDQSDGQDAEHKHYKSKHRSRHSQHDNNEHKGTYKEERDTAHRRSHGSRSRRHDGESKTGKTVEKEDKNHRRKQSSPFSYEENGGESTADEIEHHKSSHSKHKNDGCEGIYKEEKDRKRSRKNRHSRHSSSESPSRHSSEHRKKHRLSHTSHHSRDKHRHKHRKDKEHHRRHKHDSSSDDEHQHRASSGQPGKGHHDVQDDLEEGEISSKDGSKGVHSGDGKRGTSVDVMSTEQRAPSLPTEVPADLRAKIRAMLMATRS